MGPNPGRGGLNPDLGAATGSKDIQIAQRFDHPQYNVRAKVDQGIPEFYDYDLSLLQLERPVHFSATIRCGGHMKGWGLENGVWT